MAKNWISRVRGMATARATMLVFLLLIGLSLSPTRATSGEFFEFLSLSPRSEGAVSEACASDVRRLNANLKNLTTWAVEMWDASAKVEVGLLEGVDYQMGNFDECLDRRWPRRRHRGDDDDVERRYCLARVRLLGGDADAKRALHTNDDIERADRLVVAHGDRIAFSKDDMHWAICAPASCSTNDLELILSEYSYFSKLSAKYNLTYNVSLDDNLCQVDKSDVPFSPGSIVLIFLFVLLSALTIAASIYQWHLENNHAENVKKSICPEWIKAMSLTYNFSELSKKGEKSLQIVYGLRVCAIFFIILGHLGGTIMQGPVENRSHLELLFTKKFVRLLMQQLETYVDTFFALGGFFAMHFLLKYSAKSRFSFANILVGRYVRLMPLYAFVIMSVSTIMPQTGSGPQWTIMEQESANCIKNWWTNMLIINNYVNVDSMCMVHSWFIPCDFHYYILTTMLVYFMMSKPERKKAGLIAMGICLAFSIVIPFFVTYFMGFGPVMYFDYPFVMAPRTHVEYQNIYVASHTRLSAYIIGMFAGYLYHEHFKQGMVKISTLKSIVGFVSALACYTAVPLILVYCFDMREPDDPFDAAVYAALYRPVKAVCTCVMLLLCIFGNVPLVTSLLSWSPFVALGKLTYAVYLVHIVLQLRTAAYLRQPFYVSATSLIQLSVFYPVMSFIIGLILYLLIEAPITNVFKYLLTPRKKKPRQDDFENGRVNNGIEISERT